MDSDSETNLVIITRRDRFRIFCKLYWRTIILIITPILLIPIIFIRNNNGYKCFYVFLMMIIYWTTDVLHPAVIALVPIAMSSVIGGLSSGFLTELHLRNDLIDCLGVMMFIIAIEHCQIHRRIALKVLLVFGCSHFRLSFILFFTSMFLSMWISNTLACGLMMPLVKSILTELEKMGILEIYQTIGKARQKSNRHEQNVPRPSELTVFYFLGIAYSSTIGGMATITGSHTNQIFKIYCETIFPTGPKIEFPHYMLLNLPGVLVMESLLYIWMNFYFLGMFRPIQNGVAIEMTEEEAQYMDTLLATQYQQLGKIRFHEFSVASVVILAAVLQATMSAVSIHHHGETVLHDHLNVLSPVIMCVILLFLLPVNLNFLKFFRRRSEDNDPLPNSQTKSCLNWDVVNREVNWSVLLILAGSSSLFESLRKSGMTLEFEELLLHFVNWPHSATVFIVVVLCKLLAEFATNTSVVYTILPSVAKASVLCDVNPHYLMMAATLGSSLPFHLVTGSAVNAMVCAYVHIPPWKMMYAGLGPSLLAIVVVWFTVAVWSTAIWLDINFDPVWADYNEFNKTK
ncbi:protein I'm not dead yet-like [Anticarsia gemmatalis]|uniref:protein I'm not dead yet-like n=1 Tax=Anticarsia gemmatalis TaxID=129554 RepID=UPI003F75DE91